MLYEVITKPALRAASAIIFARVPSVSNVSATCAARNPTISCPWRSYWPSSSMSPRTATVLPSNSSSRFKARITSYNVCYTKLLRFDPTTHRADHCKQDNIHPKDINNAHHRLFSPASSIRWRAIVRAASGFDMECMAAFMLSRLPGFSSNTFMVIRSSYNFV